VRNENARMQCSLPGVTPMQLVFQARLPECQNRRGEQGQLQLRGCSRKDFEQEVFIPTATAAFHNGTVLAGMLFEQ